MYNKKLDNVKRERDKYNYGAVLYLKEKYNEDFEILGSIGETLGTSGDRWGAKLKNGSDNDSFTVFGSYDESGYKYSDSFYSVLIQSDYEKFVSGILINEFDNFKLFVDISKDSPNPPSLNKGVKVEDIWRYVDGEEYSFIPKITVLLPYLESQKEGYKDTLARISKKIAEYKLSAWIETYALEWEDYRSVKLDTSSCNDFEKSLSGKPDIFFIDCNYNVMQKSLYSKDFANAQEHISKEKLAQLCSVVYLNGLINNQYMGSLGEILEYIKFTNYTDSMVGKKYPCEMTREQWDTVVDGILRDSQLCSLKIIKSIDVNEQNQSKYPNILPGHRAVCFIDAFDNAYVVFRGTCGDSEWYDNATGMVLESTQQQEAAANFVNEIRNDKNLIIKQLTVTGHSKGGNKAQYAAITTADGYVNRCVALDGQGFSKSFLKRYENEIKKRAAEITLLAEQRDFVNCLGFYINSTSFYRGWRGNAGVNMPYGYPLPFFHCPDALVNENEIFGEAYNNGSIPKTLNRLVTFLLDGSKYVKDPYDIAVDVIALVMKDKKSPNDEIAEALKNVIMVFMELTSGYSDFRNDITEIVHNETNVILSTVEFAAKKKTYDNVAGSQKTLRSLVISKLVKEIFSSLTGLKCLAGTLDFFIKLTRDILKESEINRVQLIGFALRFAGDLLSNLSSVKLIKPVSDLLLHWTQLQSCFIKQFGDDDIVSLPTDLLNVGEDENINDVLYALEKSVSDWQNSFDA